MGAAAFSYQVAMASTTTTITTLLGSTNPCYRLNYTRNHTQSKSKWTNIIIKCSNSSTPNNKGFAPKSSTSTPKSKPVSRKSPPSQPNQAPGVSSTTTFNDLEFEQRLQAIKKSALEQKKSEVVKEYGVIDYDSPTETNSSKTVGLGTKIGVGVAVAVFGLVFALGDFLPTGSVSPTEEVATIDKKISAEEKEILEKRLKQFEETLAISPDDSSALEGAAVTLAEMRDFKRSATLLEKLTEKRPSDPDAFRLLGEVKYELKDFKGSIVAYKSAEKASKSIDFEILRGLTNALVAANKPDEAVQVLFATRERLNKEKSSGKSAGGDSGTEETRVDVDPIQVDLLLGKAYADWGHTSDAVSVYDQLIAGHPDDFRGYLAKGIILKQNGSVGDAERMFIQARFFAPDKAKLFVDKYSR